MASLSSFVNGGGGKAGGLEIGLTACFGIELPPLLFFLDVHFILFSSDFFSPVRLANAFAEASFLIREGESRTLRTHL